MGIEHYGKFIETEMIGVPKKETKPSELEYALGLATLESKPVLKFKDNIDLVKKLQYGDPEHPSRPFPKTVLEDLRSDEELHIADDVTFKFYTALDTNLDRRFGVDGFVEVTAESIGFKTIITLDVTTNSNKDVYKAEVIVMLPREGIDPREEKEKFEKMSHFYANKVKEVLLTKIDKYYKYRNSVN